MHWDDWNLQPQRLQDFEDDKRHFGGRGLGVLGFRAESLGLKVLGLRVSGLEFRA